MKTKESGSQFIVVSSILFTISLIVATIYIYFELTNLQGDAAGKGMAFLVLPMVFIPFSIVAVILSILYYRIIKKRKIHAKKVKVMALAPIFPFLLFIVSSVIYIVIEPKPLDTITIEIKSSRLLVNGGYLDTANYSERFDKFDSSSTEGKYYIYRETGGFQIGERKIEIRDDVINASITLEIPDTNKSFPFTEWKDMKVNNDTITVQLRYEGYRLEKRVKELLE